MTKCERCKDTGLEDSGGVQPWGEPILVECECRLMERNMDESRKVAVPDKNNPYLQSDRNRQEILQLRNESQGKEESLSFSAKEVRGILSQIIHLEERVERLERAR